MFRYSSTNYNFRLVVPFFLLFWALFVISANGQEVSTIESIPDPKAGIKTGYVSNPDNILSLEEVESLNALVADIEKSTTAQIAVVMVNSIGQENPKDFATRLFEKWGIGFADKDNGLLIFSVMDQRRTEFETGYGMEAVLPDAICYRIGMQELVPSFREGNYYEGLRKVLTRMKELLEDPSAREDIFSRRKEEGSGASGDNWWILWIYLGVNGLFHLGIAFFILFILRSKQDLFDKYMQVRKVTGILWIILFPLPYLISWFLLKRLLKRLRNMPRHSPVNGKPMVKLDEDADDEFLEEGQIVEEEIGSTDYDVWITEEKDDILVLKYKKPFSKYGQCPKCNYKTYYKARTETIRPATYSHSGKGRNIYECKNCHYQKVDYFVISKKVRSSGGGGGSGSGGGSWGGGSSGGGGAGVSW
jgi:uncharacterized protein